MNVPVRCTGKKTPGGAGTRVLYRYSTVPLPVQYRYRSKTLPVKKTPGGPGHTLYR